MCIRDSPFTPPMVLVDDPDITFECPEDVTVTPEAGAQFASATFVIPEAETNCDPIIPTNMVVCPDVSENIPGFDFIGQVGGSKYYQSHNAVDWMTANTISMTNGDY